METIVKEFKYLIEKSEYFTKLKEDRKFLLKEITNVPENDIEQIYKNYENKEKINKIRYEVAKLLKENQFNENSFEAKKKEIADQHTTADILKTWTDFSILYVFFFNPIKEKAAKCLENISEFLLNHLDVKLNIKTVNFDGSRNFGDVGTWIAFYNTECNFKEGMRYFINLYENDKKYGTYGPEKDSYIETDEYVDINKELIENIIKDMKSQINTIVKTKGKDCINNSQNSQPLNQILYGPPGTGKTYDTINKAIEILDKDFFEENKDNRNALKAKFEECKKEGQIEFVTFHQSYGYEEFIEGIKAKTNDDDEIIYEIENGVFKNFSDKARLNFTQSKSTSRPKKDFELVFKEEIIMKIEDAVKLKVATPKKYFFITEVSERTIYFEKAEGQTNHSLSIKTLKEMYNKGKNEKIKSGLSVYYDPLLKLLLENSNIINSEKIEQKNYILIIDEINRGNISKIFGELITLIEDSKRIGNNEAFEITLPYSRESFGVPKNLYLLGTMNTADRSIAPIDTALRRRFVFEEMNPNPELLSSNCNGVDLEKLLRAINARIEYLYDRDHTIGHAYFMDIRSLESLRFVFKNKIIPLLAEYFYDDWENIDLVLNNNGFIVPMEQKNDYLENVKNKIKNKTIYKISDSLKWEVEHFTVIYNGQSGAKFLNNEEI